MFFLKRVWEIRKISWIKWDNVYSNKDKGGLGVRRLREFDTALLGKWWWRLKEKCGSLWFRVLAARFRKGSLFVYADNKRGSTWWCTLVSNGCSVGTTVGSLH